MATTRDQGKVERQAGDRVIQESAGHRARLRLDEPELQAKIGGILNRHPAVGLAVGIVRDGSLDLFRGHGFADLGSSTPITEDTVFRIGSLTKCFTAIAVMQLHEQGLVDLDAPANDYLSAYKLIPARATHRPATVRHLLTYTAGLPQAVYLSRAFKPTLGEMARFGRRLPTLAEFYRGALHLVVEPGTMHIYSNHSFATLGQIVEDVSAEPLDRYFRAHIFEPLGMEHTDLLRSERVRARLATEYGLRAHGPRPARDYDLITAGGGGIYSTTKDMARYLAALLGGGANERGSVLKTETLSAMFAPQYQSDPRLPGVGLAFYRRDLGGHLIVEKDGLVRGFASQMFVAPRDGVGVVAFTNGARAAHAWLEPEVLGILACVLGVPDDAIRTAVPHHPETWGDLCGWYAFPGSLRDVMKWAVSGVEVLVRRGQLTARLVTPIPGLPRDFALHPDDDEDPDVFRIDLSGLGMGTSRVVFSRVPAMKKAALHVDLPGMPMTFHKQPATTDPRMWAKGGLGALGMGAAAAGVRRRHGRYRGSE
ncbi:MAG TPA: serine hydrolase domain-containing protein [Dermatophilaceae bacterium]|nr:serine hydrolase domain-containing protein [Dermatophilaceae bacterium]